MLSRRNALLFLVTLIAVAAAAQTPSAIELSWAPRAIAAGSPCLFRAHVAGSPSSVQAKWMGRELIFFPSSAHHLWYALAGVDVETKPGNYTLEMELTFLNNQVVRQRKTILVAPDNYKRETLRVPERFVQPDPETLQRIEAERKIKDAAFSHQAPEPEWSGRFVPPIDTTVSEGFGTRRTFNGKLASIHRGLDYHAKPGTPVTAANSGEVVLARELFYEGNCVIIDHGQQFMTLYMHLSHLEVSEGEKVEKGQEIGLSGATGRATGPHLHTAVRWQGAYLDPAQLWLLQLPNLLSAAQPGETGN
ncbi:MAG TPA: M23 family metallopeptidase [Terriglobales bacterium]|jgi:murein DD-endopeptidase MepM/ murein hydrolase activator NlpD|nr:M23 family metallopeptidase [Terriglobales bacterium]